MILFPGRFFMGRHFNVTPEVALGCDDGADRVVNRLHALSISAAPRHRPGIDGASPSVRLSDQCRTLMGRFSICCCCCCWSPTLTDDAAIVCIVAVLLPNNTADIYYIYSDHAWRHCCYSVIEISPIVAH